MPRPSKTAPTMAPMPAPAEAEAYPVPAKGETSFDAPVESAPVALSADDLVSTCHAEIRGRLYEIHYDMSDITPRVLKRLGKIDPSTPDDNADAVDAMIDFIAAVVTRWDVTDKAGRPVAVVTDAIEGLSFKDIAAIANAINGVYLPNASAVTG